VSKRDTHMPGWVSHGNVQINVARDLHIHGGCAGHAALPDDVAPPRTSVGPGLGFALMRLVIALWSLVTALYRFVCRTLLVIAWLTFGSLSVSFWALNRTAEILRAVLSLLPHLERDLGGGRAQLVYVPSFLARPRVTPTTHQLTAGSRTELAQLNTRETQYVDSN